MKKYNYSSYKANVALKIFQKIVQQQPQQQPGVCRAVLGLSQNCW